MMAETISVPPEMLIKDWETFTERYPILAAAAQANRFQHDQVVPFIDDGQEYPLGLVGPEIEHAKEAGLIKCDIHTTDSGAGTPEIRTYHVLALSKFVNLIRDLKAIVRQRPGPKSHATQITTLEGVKYNTRSDYVRMILDADLKVLADTVEGDLSQIRSAKNKRVRRRMLSELHDVVALRGKDLPRDQYGSLALRLGMPLPPDFWHLSESKVPETAKAYAHTLEPGKPFV
jgi:hypothetical protein